MLKFGIKKLPTKKVDSFSRKGCLLKPLLDGHTIYIIKYPCQVYFFIS
jgi:hypothetical protein